MKTARSRDIGPRRLAALVTGLFALVGTGVLATLVLAILPLVARPGLVADLLGSVWDPLRGHYGLTPFLVGTAVVTGVAVGLAIPFSLGVAVTLGQGWLGRIRASTVKTLTVLTAVPSVIFGWWGMLVVVPWVRGYVGGAGFSLLAAGLVLALMLTPTLSLLFYHALNNVPRALREGSAALGATPDQTLLRVILPCALPALVQALLVGVARALGETMAVQMVIGGQTALPSGLASPGATLTTQILTDMTLFPPGTQGHAVLDAMALVLMVGMYWLVRISGRWGSN